MPTMTTQPLQITGVILAGGRGTRMGGVDKGLMPFLQTTLVQHVLGRLSHQVDRILINVNANQSRYEAFGFPLLPDMQAGHPGPLAGVQSALAACTTPLLLSVPCDAPLLPTDLAERLNQAIRNEGGDAAVAVSRRTDGSRSREPVFCLMKSSLLESLNRYLSSGRRAVTGWHEELSIAEVIFDDDHAFSNVNTLEQLRECELSCARGI